MAVADTDRRRQDERHFMARILVVEDNPANLKLASFLLERAGHEVIAAADAAEGLAHTESLHFDLVLMDIQLPGMDGLEATRVLKSRETTRAVPVLALTALAMKGDRERILAAGCDGYIAKPFSHDTFAAAVEQWLRATAPSGERATGKSNDASLIE
jgi:two-component system, cell cycle response regulator DivK